MDTADKADGRGRDGTPLKALCQQRHLHAYASFKRAYEKVAGELGDDFTGIYPSEKTLRRWLAGDLSELPRSEHCVILEALFPGWTARQLFGLEPPNPIAPGAVAVLGGVHTRPAGYSTSEALVTSAHESADFLAWAELDNVGDMTIDQIQADVRELSRSYLKVDTEPLFARVVALRNRLFELLRGRQRPAQTRELYSAAGWTLTLLAWVSIDLGQPEAAETHLRAAQVCAEKADHDVLRAWIAATRHTAAFWRDDYGKAAQHAINGLQFAPSGSGAALFLTSALALDLAKYGDRHRARELLAAARRQADGLGRTDVDGLAGPLACTPSRAGGFWADAQLALSEPQPALQLASQSIATFEAAPYGHRNHGSERMVRCEQVKAYLALGEYDGAAQALGPVLETGAEHRVRPLVRRVTEIAWLAGSADTSASHLRTIVDSATDFLQLTNPHVPRSLS